MMFHVKHDAPGFSLFPEGGGIPAEHELSSAEPLQRQEVSDAPADLGAADPLALVLPVAPSELPPRWPAPASVRTIAVANQKGGVGKTTTVVNLAAALAEHGNAVLVVDMDPQGNASTALGCPDREGVAGCYEVVVEESPVSDVVFDAPTLPGVRLLASNPDLAGAQVELVAADGREYRLRRALAEAAAEYDYVLIDCPPGLDLLTVNALVAADEVLVPMQCEYYSLEGLSQLQATIEQVRTYLNPDLVDGPILLTMYDQGTELAEEVAREVRSYFPDRVMATTIPRSAEIGVAPSHGRTVIGYRPFGTGAQAYMVAAAELADVHTVVDLRDPGSVDAITADTRSAPTAEGTSENSGGGEAVSESEAPQEAAPKETAAVGGGSHE